MTAGYYYEIEQGNLILLKKLKMMFLIFIFYTVTASIFHELNPLTFPNDLSFESPIPTIARFGLISTFPGLIAATLGVGMVISPFGGGYLAIGDPVRARIALALSRPNSNAAKTIAFVYLLAAPTFILILWFIYSVPASLFITKPITFGANMLYLVAGSKIFLSVVGSVLVIGMTLFFYMIILMVMIPFLPKWKEND